jgi:hypothetical protein
MIMNEVINSSSIDRFNREILKPFQKFTDLGKCIVSAQSEFAREKPIKALIFLAAIISFVVIPIIIDMVAPPIILGLLAVFVVAHIFNCYTLASELIPRIYKFSALQFIDKNRIENYQNKEIILVLKAEEDQSGALNSFPEIVFAGTYPLAMRKVSRVTQIFKAINDAVSQGNIIKGLFIHAHGHPDLIGLGKIDKTMMNKIEELSKIRLTRPLSVQECQNFIQYTAQILDLTINRHNIGQLETSINKLDKLAFITLFSCSTAGTAKYDEENIASCFAKIANGRIVTAGSESISTARTIIDPKTLEVKFFAFNKRGVVNSIKNVIGGLLLEFKSAKCQHFLRDITRTYSVLPASTSTTC